MADHVPDVACVSLGMVIIDEIHMANREPLLDIIGGSTIFVTLGQRLFAKDVSQVGCIVITGDDFPLSFRQKIEEWGTTTVFKVREGKLSTRGKLVYKDDTFGPKDFEYIHPPLRASPSDLLDTPLLHAQAFHFLGAPTEVVDQVLELLRLRNDIGIRERPLIVWEPLPASCTPQNYPAFLQACKLVDVFSPNHLELAALFEKEANEPFDTVELEIFSQAILDAGIGSTGDGVIITRAGEHGALSVSRASRLTWLPSYYEKDSSKVVDPTGAGNAFLGGYIAGWQVTRDVTEAAYYGHVAASFALEQIGLPEVTRQGGTVLCNGVSVLERLGEYRKRVGEAEVRSEGVL